MSKTCPNGHPYTPASTYRPPGRGRQCRICRRLADKRRYRRSRESRRMRGRQIYANNVEREKQRVIDWQKANPEKVRRTHLAATHRRRARKSNQLGNWPLPEQEVVSLLWYVQNGSCLYCNKALLNEAGAQEFDLEHMIPLSREGLHSWDNVCLSCKTCNYRKGILTAEEFMNEENHDG